MNPVRIPPWARRAGIAALGVLAVLLVGLTWYFSSLIGAELFTPRPYEPDPDLEVVAIGEGRIVLTRTDLSEQEGIWGVAGANGYGQVSAIVQVRGEEVERSFRPLDGEIVEGDFVRFDQYAYIGDPRSALGLSFEDVQIPGDLGVLPAWLVDGDRDTWVVIVHGKGLEERKQALRIIPTLEQARYPVLVITYRNDAIAPPSSSGYYGWGLEEWRDLEAAVQFALNRGADEVVLMGYSMGGAIASMFLHESDLVSEVRGVILDSPVLDLEAVVDSGARERRIPGFVTAMAKALAGIRYGVEWDELDQVARAGAFDVPVLLMHGGEDATVPVEVSDAFAAALPQLVTYQRFDGADHVYLWNTNPQRYERAVAGFLDSVAGSPR